MRIRLQCFQLVSQYVRILSGLRLSVEELHMHQTFDRLVNSKTWLLLLRDYKMFQYSCTLTKSFIEDCRNHYHYSAIEGYEISEGYIKQLT